MSKLMNGFIAAIAALSFLVAVPAVSHAQAQGESTKEEAVAVRVGIVDIDGVRAKASATASMRSQLTKYRDKIQSDIKKEEDELRKANDELSRQRSIMTPDAFKVEREKFEQRLVALQKRVQESKRALAESQSKASSEIDAAIRKIIGDLTKEEGYTLLINKSAVIASAVPLNVTENALQRLNKELPSVKVPDPAIK